uniref:uncharacterized protein LOC117268329 n=1 Tax=Epinephelus lanceolatus TaxID=310571 RepID=UPI0014486192|nr:uncharacterized protein LOC117268329 [Epinephelus lanceolatus]
MPQHTHSSLTHVLLLWITTLSVVQLGFIVFFFTAGRSQNSSDVAPQHTKAKIQANNTSSYPSEPGIPLGGGKMLTFKATEVNSKIKWVTKSPDERLISGAEGGKVLKIKKDGYYFLSLQITLNSCNAKPLEHTVSLKAKDKDLLKGWINNNTCSTGSLSKVEELPAGSTLEVTVCETGPNETINEEESHLDIIYIFKPWK